MCYDYPDGVFALILLRRTLKQRMKILFPSFPCESPVLALTLMLLILFPIPLVFAEEPAMPSLPHQNFPDWMDKVSFPSQGGKTGGGPKEPIDPQPTSDIKPPQGPAKGSRINFIPPKFPDFSAMRKKATRMSYEKTGSGTERITSETVQLVNLDASRRKAEELASQALLVPPGPGRQYLENLANHERTRIAAMEELQNIVANASGTGTDQPGTAGRIEELRKIIFPELPREKIGQTPSVAASATSEPSREQYRIPSRFERPEPLTSLFLERKQEQKDEETPEEPGESGE